MNKNLKKVIAPVAAAAMVFAVPTGVYAEDGAQEKITFCLDWTPNTNHTGLYVAQAKGYYEEAGLDVEIVQPPENGAALMCAAGQAQFAINYLHMLSIFDPEEMILLSVYRIRKNITFVVIVKLLPESSDFDFCDCFTDSNSIFHFISSRIYSEG